jgi:NAD(P)-dependent dehydrogenase (short-subunit alcohol dehydrogenase family)
MDTSITFPYGNGYTTKSLSGKRVLVTGGTKGIGRAVAILLASKGARVLILGRNEDPLNDVLEQCRQLGIGGNISGFTADIAEKEGVEKAFAEVDQQLGGLDILINNAAIAFESIDSGGYDDWRYLLNANLLACIACTEKAVSRMSGRQGDILFVGSLSAKHRGENSAIYSASKSGLQAFAEALRKDMKDKQIRISLIEPGAVGTDMQVMPDEEKLQQQRANEMLYPEDIAAWIYFTLIQPWRNNLMMARVLPVQQQI